MNLTAFFNFLEYYEPQQFGFRKGYSKSHYLYFAISREDKSQVLAIFTDFSKASNHYGIRGNSISILTGYLLMRNQCYQRGI